MSPLPPTPFGPGSEQDAPVLAVCPLCEATYHPLTSQVIAARDDAHLLFLECRRCGTASIALVTASQVGISTVGAMTDLTPPEVLAFVDQEPVGDDDVISMAHELAHNDLFVQTLRRPN